MKRSYRRRSQYDADDRRKMIKEEAFRDDPDRAPAWYEEGRTAYLRRKKDPDTLRNDQIQALARRYFEICYSSSPTDEELANLEMLADRIVELGGLRPHTPPLRST